MLCDVRDTSLASNSNNHPFAFRQSTRWQTVLQGTAPVTDILQSAGPVTGYQWGVHILLLAGSRCSLCQGMVRHVCLPPPPLLTHSHLNSWKLQMPNGLSVSTTNSKCQFTTSLGRVPYKETSSVGALMQVAGRVGTHISWKINIVFGAAKIRRKKSWKSNPLTTGSKR